MSNRQDATALAALAVAQAVTGDASGARSTAREAIERARATGDAELVRVVESKVGTLAR